MLCPNERISKDKGSSGPASARVTWYCAGKGEGGGLCSAVRGIALCTYILIAAFSVLKQEANIMTVISLQV